MSTFPPDDEWPFDEFETTEEPLIDDGGEIHSDIRQKAREILDRIDAGSSVITVAGPAGSGKTALIRCIVDERPDALVMAPTNQAARMLNARGLSATTIHKAMCRPRGNQRDEIDRVNQQINRLENEGGDPKLIAKLYEELKQLTELRFVVSDDSQVAHAPLCILDEASMVGRDLGRDIHRLAQRLVVLGDPYQLPPVGESSSYFDLDNPDVMLTTIFRQEGDSAILDLATDIREGKFQTRNRPWPEYGEDVAICALADVKGKQREEWLLGADQIICFKNETRRDINRTVLRYKGITHRYPRGEDGEKLICTQADSQLAILNGTPVRICQNRDDGNPDYFVAQVQVENDVGNWIDKGEAKIYRAPFDFTADRVDQPYADNKLARDSLIREPLFECDWAYAISTHKSQGSEWGRVVLVADQWPSAKEYRRQILYTAVTRAREWMGILVMKNA